MAGSEAGHGELGFGCCIYSTQNGFGLLLVGAERFELSTPSPETRRRASISLGQSPFWKRRNSKHPSAHSFLIPKTPMCYNVNMSKDHTIILTDETRTQAERRVKEEGFDSVEAYISALIRDDAETSLGIAWLRERIEAGLASGNAGPMTSEKLDRLIGEGIARVTR